MRYIVAVEQELISQNTIAKVLLYKLIYIEFIDVYFYIQSLVHLLTKHIALNFSYILFNIISYFSAKIKDLKK